MPWLKFWASPEFMFRLYSLLLYGEYKSHGSELFIAAHGIGSTLEFCIGLAAILNPDSKQLAHSTAFLALFVNIPTGFWLTPRVFGIKHLTVMGFGKYGLLRIMEVTRVFYVNHRLVANLWILLHVGILSF